MFRPIRYDPKDPLDVGQYDLDFTAELNSALGETITSAVITTSKIPTGASQLTTTAPIVYDNVVSTVISGGTVNTTCLVTYTVTTSLSNVISRSVILPIQQR